MMVNKKKALELLEGDLELYDRVCSVFLSDTPKQLDELDESVRSQNLELAGRKVHSLKSASRSVGADDLSALCARMEKTIVSGNWASVAAEAKEVREEFSRVRTILVAAS